MTTHLSNKSGKTFFVAKSGHNDNIGSSSSPWLTIQHAINQVKPGDTIKVKSGIYYESVTIKNSGEKDFLVTLEVASGHQAIIDGSKLPTQKPKHGFYIAPHQQYITIKGFEIKNFHSQKDWDLATGIYVSGNAKHIRIIDNHIHHISSTAKKPIANGIGIYGLDKSPSTDITIINNHLHDLTLGWSEALVLNGNIENFVIKDNHIHHTNNIGIDIIGHETWVEKNGVPKHLNFARKGHIDSNYVHHIDSLTNPVYEGGRSAGGIYVDGGKHVKITNNIVHHANIGIEIASENPGYASKHIEVSNNVVFKNHIGGIALGGYDQDRGQATHNTIRNNVFYHNDSDHLGHGELWLQHAVKDNRFQNNIFYANKQGVLLSSVLPHTFNASNNNLIDNNWYYTEALDHPNYQGKWMLGGQTLETLEKFQTLYGKDIKSQFKGNNLTFPTTGNFQSFIMGPNQPGLTNPITNKDFIASTTQNKKQQASTQEEVLLKASSPVLSNQDLTPSYHTGIFILLGALAFILVAGLIKNKVL